MQARKTSRTKRSTASGTAVSSGASLSMAPAERKSPTSNRVVDDKPPPIDDTITNNTTTPVESVVDDKPPPIDDGLVGRGRAMPRTARTRSSRPVRPTTAKFRDATQ